MGSLSQCILHCIKILLDAQHLTALLWELQKSSCTAAGNVVNQCSKLTCMVDLFRWDRRDSACGNEGIPQSRRPRLSHSCRAATPAEVGPPRKPQRRHRIHHKACPSTPSHEHLQMLLCCQMFSCPPRSNIDLL